MIDNLNLLGLMFFQKSFYLICLTHFNTASKINFFVSLISSFNTMHLTLKTNLYNSNSFIIFL